MAITLNPPPLKAMGNLPYVVQEYLRQIYNLVASTANAIAWTSVSKAGANLTDIPTRLHNQLQGLQGGSGSSYFHLSRALSGNKTIAFGSLPSVSNTGTTITVTGAQVGDSVILNPSSVLEAGICIDSFVSSTNTVTVTATNPTAGSITIASRTYNVLVIAP